MNGSHLSGAFRIRNLDVRRPLFWCPALKLAVHVATLAGYGVFRDELYYLACADRLDVGYVDHPPLSIWILRLVREVFGEALWPMRAVAALAGASAVLLVGLTARRLGAGTWGQATSMLLFMAVPIFWFSGHVYSMNAFEPLIWALVGLLWLGHPEREESDARSPHWLVLGVVLGLGLLNKASILWLGAGLGVALLVGSLRPQLKTLGPWICGCLAMLIWAPFLIWQAAHGGPMLEFMHNATGAKMQSVSAAGFVLRQIEMLGPIAAVFLGMGLVILAMSGGRRRDLGWIYATVFLILLLSGSSRSGYLAPAYTWPAAAFGAWVDGRLGSRKGLKKTLQHGSILGLILFQGLVLAPLALPILSVDTYVRYAEALGVTPGTEERKAVGRLPQHFADMFGWKEKTAAARRAFEGLNVEDRAKVCLAAQNYGVAGALEREDLLVPPAAGEVPREPLPAVLSGHNSYWFWRPSSCTGEILIVLGDDAETLSKMFGSVEQVDTVRCEPCMPYEDEQPVWLAREPRITFDEVWPAIKSFN